MNRVIPPVFAFLFLLASCSGLEESEKEKIRQMNAIGEYIYRAHGDIEFPLETPVRHIRDNYPWEDTYVGNQVKITKEFFRCKGSSQNQARKREVGGLGSFIVDCGGMLQHSLPLKDGKEFVYPILLELVNYVQEKTQKKVLITCGHRCPTHNTYSDNKKWNQTSKHMIGAEVDFYVKGYEWSPEKIVDILKQFYQEKEPYCHDERFTTFSRYERQTNVSTLPWFNKEVFIKLFKKDEGRDFDNNHRFPYVCIQVKWDRDADEPVTYSWPKAFNGYLRY